MIGVQDRLLSLSLGLILDSKPFDKGIPVTVYMHRKFRYVA